MKDINIRIRIVRHDEIEIYEEIWNRDKHEFDKIDTYLFTMKEPYNINFLKDYIRHLQTKYFEELEH